MSNTIDARRAVLVASLRAAKATGNLAWIHSIKKKLKALRGASEVNHQFEAPSPHTSND